MEVFGSRLSLLQSARKMANEAPKTLKEGSPNLEDSSLRSTWDTRRFEAREGRLRSGVGEYEGKDSWKLEGEIELELEDGFDHSFADGFE